MVKTYLTLVFAFLALQPSVSHASPFNCYCHAMVDSALVKNLDNIGKFDSSNHRGSCEHACKEAIISQVSDWCSLASSGGQKLEWYSTDNKKGKTVDLGYYACPVNGTAVAAGAPAVTPVLDSGCTWVITPSNPQFISSTPNAATCPNSLNGFPYVANCVRTQFVDQCYGWSPTQRSAMVDVVCPPNQKVVSGNPNNLPDTCAASAKVAMNDLPSSPDSMLGTPLATKTHSDGNPTPTPTSTPKKVVPEPTPTTAAASGTPPIKVKPTPFPKQIPPSAATPKYQPSTSSN